MKKTINRLTDTQAAYIAGIIDGEGHIGLCSGQVVVAVTQAEKGVQLLHMLKDCIGGGTITLHRKATGNWSTVYRYRIQSTHMNKQLYSYIKKYLIVKKESFDGLLSD